MRSLAFTFVAAVALTGCFFGQTDDAAFDEASGAGTGTSGSSASSGSGSGASSVSSSSSSSASSGSSGSTGSASTGSTSSGSGSSSGSSGGTSGSGSASTSSGGSSGGSGASFVPLLVSSSSMRWVALAITPSNASNERIAMVGGDPNGTGDRVQLFYADGGAASASTPASNGNPRALTIDSSNLTLVEQTGLDGWQSLTWSLSNLPNSLGSASSLPCTASGGGCGEVIDVAGTANLPVTLSATIDPVNGNAPALIVGFGGSAWSLCPRVDGTPHQLAFTLPSEADVLLDTGPNGSVVTPFAADCSASVPRAGASATLTSMMVDGQLAVLGGHPDSANQSLFTAALGQFGEPWSSLGAFTFIPVDVITVATAVRSNSGQTPNFAGMYLDQGTLHVFRLVNGESNAEIQALTGASPVQPIAPNSPVSVPGAGHQVAVTSSGAVFFITAEGAFYWPAP